MGLGLLIAWKLQLRKIDLPPGTPMPMADRLKATAKAFWALLMPLIIIGGMKTGIFTPTEAAVVAAFYALVVSFAVHREMSLPRPARRAGARGQDDGDRDVPVRRRAGRELHDHAGGPAGRADRLARRR